jgi:hypothetical protein
LQQGLALTLGQLELLGFLVLLAMVFLQLVGELVEVFLVQLVLVILRELLLAQLSKEKPCLLPY